MKFSTRPQVPTLILCVLAAVLGFFLRLNQLRLEMRADGTVAWGGAYSIALAVACVIFAAALICLLLPLSKQPTDCAVFSGKPLANGLLLLAAALLAAGNILNWSNLVLPTLSAGAGALAVLLPLLGVAAAGCLAAFAILRLRGRSVSPLLYMCVSLYLALRLILSFQGWNSDPAVQDYCYAMLAIICAMLAIFQLAGFGFGRGKRRITLFWALCAWLFCVIDMADGFFSMDLQELCIHGAMLMTVGVHGVSLLFTRKPESAEDN